MTEHECQRGVSLVELLVAMAMATTVLGGAVAAIGLSGRTFRSATDGIQSAGAIDALARMSSDIQLALDFTERTSTATTFWVHDRTGDGAPELIRYAWSGTPGDPLTFSMNGSSPVEIVPAVGELSLDYLVASLQGISGWVGVPTEYDDELIFHRAYQAMPFSHALSETSAIAAIVRPEDDDDDEEYQVTRVSLWIAGAGAGAPNVRVALYRVNGQQGVPTGDALATAIISQASLSPTPTEVVVDLYSSARTRGDRFVAVVISQGFGVSAGSVPLRPSDGWEHGRIATTDSQGTWTLNQSQSMPIRLRGFVEEEDD